MKDMLKRILRYAGLQRKQIAAGRMFCERHWLAATGRHSKRQTGRILCYHSVGQSDWGVNDVSPAQFRRHIELALGANYRFLLASDIARSGGNARDLAITFDDGCKSVLTHAAPILRDYGLPWSFFPVSQWCDQSEEEDAGAILTWSEVEKLVADGAEIGSHSATHPDFGEIGHAQTLDELVCSRQAIEQRIGIAPVTFAIPLGQSMNWTPFAARAAQEAGYEIVYAQAEETRPSGTVSRTFVTHFDNDRIFSALLRGAYDRWEEWV